jgi:hypothetical protein
MKLITMLKKFKMITSSSPKLAKNVHEEEQLGEAQTKS